MVDLTICIVSFNARDTLNNCLTSIFTHEKKLSFEIIVVDNNSSDNSVRMIQEAYPSVKLICNKFNRGFASANNQAIRIATGKNILLLNQDTLLIHDNSIKSMVDFLDSNHEAGVCGCVHLDLDMAEVNSNDSFPNVFSVQNISLRNLFPKRLKKSEVNVFSPLECDVITGACFLFKRSLIDKIGFMDEDFFFYYEETEWCYRVKKAGWKIYWLPFVEIIHIGGRRFGDTPIFLEKYFRKSEFYYFKKTSGIFVAYLYLMLFFSFCTIEVLKATLGYYARYNTDKRRMHLQNLKNQLDLIAQTLSY